MSAASLALLLTIVLSQLQQISSTVCPVDSLQLNTHTLSSTSSCTCYDTTALYLDCQQVSVRELRRLLSALVEGNIGSPPVVIQLLNLRSLIRRTNNSLSGNLLDGVTVRELRLTAVPPLLRIRKSFLSGTEKTLVRLSLTKNRLRIVPRAMLRSLSALLDLNLADNIISKLSKTDFFGLQLHYLELSNNRIDTINDQSLYELQTTLKSLRLSGNLLTSIPLSAIQNLQVLTQLDLSRNQINEIGRPNFSTKTGAEYNQQKSLQELDLSYNSLRAMKFPAAFAVFPNLQQLSLHANHISFVHTDVFSGCPQLEYLDFSANRLKTVHSQLLVHLPLLQVLDLSQNHLHVIPDGFLSNQNHLRELFLSSNNILKITSAAFNNASELYVLDLHNNGIHSIEPDAFSTMQKLSQLNLHDNQIRWLPGNVLTANIDLTVLRLDNNRLQLLEPGLFAATTSLQQLQLSGNNLKQLKDDDLKTLKSLQDLYLDSNNIKIIGVSALGHLHRLQYCSFSHNGLEHLEISPRGLPNNLIILELNHNRLQRVPNGTFSGLFVLEVLWLNDNKLESIPVSSFKDLIQLRSLHLQENRIDHIENGTLGALSSLTELDLSSNKLSRLFSYYFSGLSSLERLNLSRNIIAQIEEGVFDQMKNLISLDLSYNQLSVVKRSTFEGGIPLRRLYLKSCSIFQIEEGSFQDLPKLELLDLKYNMMHTITLDFMWISSLHHLDLSGNMVSDLMSNVYHGLPGLKVLHMRNMNLLSLPKLLLTDNRQLVELHLGQNRLSSFNTQNLQNVQKLQRLLLEKNELTSLDLANLTSLSFLNISENKITDIDQVNLFNLTNLETLDLSMNMLKTVSKSFMRSIKNLKHLYLRHNLIKSLKSFFDVTIELKLIDLSFNLLKNIDRFTHGTKISRITNLILNGNPIEQIKLERSSIQIPKQMLKVLIIRETNLTSMSSEDLSAFPRLTRAIFCRNRIIKLSPGVFRQQKLLQHLDLSRNRLKILPTERTQGLFSLITLNVSRNRLKKLDVFSNDLKYLRHLDLSSNQIKRIEQSTFRALVSLATLNLSKNRISQLDFHAADYLWSLQQLSLADNSLMNISHHLLSTIAVKLESIDLSGNPLKCDCNLVEAWRWMLQHRHLVSNAENTTCAAPAHPAAQRLTIEGVLMHCAAENIQQVDIQGVKRDSLTVSWNTGNGSSNVTSGFLVTYTPLDNTDSEAPVPSSQSVSTQLVHKRPLMSASHSSLKLQQLQADTVYRVCVSVLDLDLPQVSQVSQRMNVIKTHTWRDSSSNSASSSVVLSADYLIGEVDRNLVVTSENNCAIVRTLTSSSEYSFAVSGPALIISTSVGLLTLLLLCMAILYSRWNRSRQQFTSGHDAPTVNANFSEISKNLSPIRSTDPVPRSHTLHSEQVLGHYKDWREDVGRLPQTQSSRIRSHGPASTRRPASRVEEKEI